MFHNKLPLLLLNGIATEDDVFTAEGVPPSPLRRPHFRRPCPRYIHLSPPTAAKRRERGKTCHQYGGKFPKKHAFPRFLDPLASLESVM